ncbi:MAG: hypothetical protein RQ885_13000 [Desulfurococcales archaeon]|nr:hypothetical protein [Desulfurococcales archaeon]
MKISLDLGVQRPRDAMTFEAPETSNGGPMALRMIYYRIESVSKKDDLLWD